jgi:hypothetical protein
LNLSVDCNIIQLWFCRFSPIQTHVLHRHTLAFMVPEYCFQREFSQVWYSQMESCKNSSSNFQLHSPVNCSTVGIPATPLHNFFRWPYPNRPSGWPQGISSLQESWSCVSPRWCNKHSDPSIDC